MIPGVKPLFYALTKWSFNKSGSSIFWENRYASGGNSGKGSYGRLALYKANIINSLISEFNINSIIELGCGDGNQTSLLEHDVDYLGLDISPTVIEQNLKTFFLDQKKDFLLFDSNRIKNIGVFLNADMAISLDVLYHLVELNTFESYLSTLFAVAKQYVVIYASDDEGIKVNSPHIFIRAFTPYITEHFKDFQLVRSIKNEYYSNQPSECDTGEYTWSDFFVYERISFRDCD